MKNMLFILTAIIVCLLSCPRKTLYISAANDVTYIVSYIGTELSASEQLEVQKNLIGQDLTIQETLNKIKASFSNDLNRMSFSVRNIVKSEKINEQQSLTVIHNWSFLIKIAKVAMALLTIAFLGRAVVELFQ